MNASAADSRTDHAPASLPGTEPAAAAPHVANESISSTPPVRVKKPRLTSVHSGVRNRSTSPPETVSARTSALTPAGPDTARAYPGRRRTFVAGDRPDDEVLRTAGTPVGWPPWTTGGPTTASRRSTRAST